MLIMKDEYDIVHNFLLVDAHTHIKIEELEGLVPSEFIRKYYKMLVVVVNDIKKNESQYRYKFPWELDGEQPEYYDYCQRDVYSVLHPGEDLSESAHRFLGFDFVVTFSSNLTSRLPRDYRVSNSKVREKLVEKSPKDNSPHNNFRFVGFGRLDPNHSDALDALDNIHQLGLRGLKLHPKEENFDITGKKARAVMKRAAHFNLPIIFHTQDGSADRIHELVELTLKDFVREDDLDMIPRLKVILGHAPWNGVGNKELYRILSHPNIFGELSTLKSESYEEFFSNSKSLIRYDGIFDSPTLSELNRKQLESILFNTFGYNSINYWSSKLMFGSDTPYPPSHSAAPLLKYLFSKQFIGNASDVRNITSASILRLIPTIAQDHTQEGQAITSTGKKHHLTQLETLSKDSKALGLDPLIEPFPVVKISGAVFSFLRDGDVGSNLFKSMFDPEKPYNMVLPNPYDLSLSSVLSGRISLTKNIETNLGEE